MSQGCLTLDEKIRLRDALEKRIEARMSEMKKVLEETHNSVSVLPKEGESYMNWTKRMVESDEVDTERLGIDE